MEEIIVGGLISWGLLIFLVIVILLAITSKPNLNSPLYQQRLREEQEDLDQEAAYWREWQAGQHSKAIKHAGGKGKLLP